MIDIWSSIECRYGWAIDYHGNFELSSHIATISDNNVSSEKIERLTFTISQLELISPYVNPVTSITVSIGVNSPLDVNPTTNSVSSGKYRLCWSLRCSLSKCSIGLLEVLSAIIRLHFSSISRNSLWVKINPNLRMWLNNACFMLIWFCCCCCVELYDKIVLM